MGDATASPTMMNEEAMKGGNLIARQRRGDPESKGLHRLPSLVLANCKTATEHTALLQL